MAAATLWAADASSSSATEKIAPIAARYGLELDPSTIAALCRDHGLTFG
jgi:hypothetical protein